MHKMGFFGTTPDPITEEVEKATNENNTEDDWATIMNICDKAGKTSEDAKHYLKAIIKRLLHADPHVQVQAATLLDACVKNAKKTFHTEVASREFEDNFIKCMTKCHPQVAKTLRLSLKKWSENEFKNDPQLNLIPTLYSKLKSDDFDFSTEDGGSKKVAPVSKDPNVVESQEEEEAIMKAIELSLKETSGSPRNTSSTPTSTSLYPSTNVSASASANTTPAKEPRKVRALYDFEAAEDNELTFSVGEIIFVLEDSHPTWWKGSNQRGEGLFPANFVTADLSIEPEKFAYDKGKKVQFKESVDVKTLEKEPEEVEIDEGKIDRVLHLLHEADPTNPEKDTEEMVKLEKECNAMQPLIDTELERVDRKHAQLTQLSSNLVEALSLYHTLMREPQIPPIQKMPYGYNPNQIPQSSSMTFNGTLPHTGMGMGQPGMSVSNVMTAGMERPVYMQPGSMQPQSIPPQYHTLPHGMMSNRVPIGQMPPGTQSVPNINPPGMPMQPHMQAPAQMTEDMRHDPAAGPYPGMQNYGPTSLPQNFQQPPGGSQTHLQNLPQAQGPHYIPPSHSRIM